MEATFKKLLSGYQVILAVLVLFIELVIVVGVLPLAEGFDPQAVLAALTGVVLALLVSHQMDTFQALRKIVGVLQEIDFKNDVIDDAVDIAQAGLDYVEKSRPPVNIGYTNDESGLAEAKG